MIKYIFILLILLTSCGKDNDLIDINKSDLRPVKVGNVEFQYTGDLLTEVINPSGSYLKTKYLYDGDENIVEINYFDELEVLKIKEIFTYNDNLLTRSTRQRINEDLVFVESKFTDYYYDGENRLDKTIDSDNRSIEYSWSDGNITRVSYIDKNEQVLYYTEYEYDDKASFKFCNPFYNLYGQNLSKNNEIRSETITVGNIFIDLICDVCITEYEYLGGRPISYTSPWGTKFSITYK